MASKNERAAQARAKAQQQVKAKERRTTVIVIAVSLLVIGVFASVVYFIVESSKVPTLADVEWPAGADATGGILVGSDDAELRTDVYVDFLCPYCKEFEELNGDMLLAKSDAGEISLYFHPLSFLNRYSAGTEYPTRAANAAAVVADQSAEHFTAFTEALFANQPAENTPGLSDEEIAQIAVSVGVPQDVADTFKDGEFTDWVVAASQQASMDGVTTTPSFMVNRELVPQQEVPYMQPGVLEQYLNSLLAE